MTTAAQRRQHERWLNEITCLPTAAGREDRVVAWVESWVAARSNLRLRRDGAGNLLITQKNRSTRPPIYVTAHLDHPAFVVRDIIDRRTLDLEFRGGVHNAYFEDAPIEIIDEDDTSHSAVITELDAKATPFKRATARLSRPTDDILAGDIGRWRFRGALPRVRKGILYTHACDDLAAVAAALGMLDVIRRRKGMANVGILLTLAEEVGFIGTLEACRRRTVPKSSRLICLENSRSFPESPIGAGPIVRVGDRISVFMPELTNLITRLMMDHQKRHPDFRWQRKLMAGGSCEATAFSVYGYASTCLCLPLGNYHNMQDIDGVLAGKRPARMGPEHISIADYHGLIEMLIVTASRLDNPRLPDMRTIMDGWLKKAGHVIK